MAFYSDEDEETQDPNAEQPQVPQAGGSFIQGQGSASGSSAQAGAASAPQGSPDSPGNFVGISKYIDANKPQTAKLAQRVGGFVNQQGVEATNALGGAKGQFDQDVAKNTISFNEGLLGEVKDDPTKVASDAAKKAEILKMRDAEYKGPSTLEETDYFQPVMQAVSKAKQTADNTKTVQGRGALLTDVQNQAGNKSSAGAATLDNALLGTSDDAKRTLARSRDRVAGLDPQLQKAQSDAAAAAGQVKAGTDDIRAKTRAGLSQGVDALTSGLTARQADISKAQQASFDSLMADLADGKPDPDNLSTLGLRGGDRLWDVDLKDPKFVSKADAADIGSIANADEYAKYAALAELSGMDPTLLKQSDIGKAGTASNVGYKVDQKALSTALAQKQQDYNQEASPISKELSELWTAAKAGIRPDIIARKKAELEGKLAAIQEKYGYNNQVGAATPGFFTGPQLKPI